MCLFGNGRLSHQNLLHLSGLAALLLDALQQLIVTFGKDCAAIALDFPQIPCAMFAFGDIRAGDFTEKDSIALVFARFPSPSQIVLPDKPDLPWETGGFLAFRGTLETGSLHD